jgi:hypothetical protein
MTTKQEIWAKFHSYDHIKGVHARLSQYVRDNGNDEHLNYFIAHLSHEVYKTRGGRGHLVRQHIRENLREIADNKIRLNPLTHQPSSMGNLHQSINVKENNMRRHNTKKSDKFIAIVAIICVAVIGVVYVPAIRAFILTLASLFAIAVSIGIFVKHKRMNNGEWYEIQHHCPRCNHMNLFRKLYGTDHPLAVKCHKCGNVYTR